MTVETTEPQKAEFLRGNNETVLVVDDEDSMREMLGKSLEAFGYNVLLASDGVQALEVYFQYQNSIAAVVADVMMPVMNGPDFIRALRKHNPHIKIMMISGLDTSVTRPAIEELGIQHFVAKPFTVEGILAKMREILTPVAS